MAATMSKTKAIATLRQAKRDIDAAITALNHPTYTDAERSVMLARDGRQALMHVREVVSALRDEGLAQQGRSPLVAAPVNVHDIDAPLRIEYVAPKPGAYRYVLLRSRMARTAGTNKVALTPEVYTRSNDLRALERLSGTLNARYGGVSGTYHFSVEDTK